VLDISHVAPPPPQPSPIKGEGEEGVGGGNEKGRLIAALALSRRAVAQPFICAATEPWRRAMKVFAVSTATAASRQ
jgi:hypothetical protein